MKRRILSLVFAVAVLLTLTACSGELKTGDAVDHTVNMLEGVSLAMERTTATSAVYALINDGEETITFGQGYNLQAEVDGTWYTIEMKKDMVTTANLLILEPGDRREETINWNRVYGKLPDGCYRLVCGVFLASDESLQIPYVIAGEFVVE